MAIYQMNTIPKVDHHGAVIDTRWKQKVRISDKSGVSHGISMVYSGTNVFGIMLWLYLCINVREAQCHGVRLSELES